MTYWVGFCRGPGEWLTLENEYTETIRLHLLEQHGDDVEIGNEKIR